MALAALSLLAVWLLAACGSGEARTIKGRVERVADGDTIILIASGGRRERIRFYGIDAPELHQTHGAKSKAALEKLLAGREISVEGLYRDDYGRVVGIVMADGANVNERLIQSGHAWFYDHFCKKSFCREWRRKEEEARRARRGLWREKNPEPPWSWRRANRRR